MRRQQRVYEGCCYFCDRPLTIIARLSVAKTQAFNKDMLTCGFCGTFGKGYPTWRQGDRAHNNRRAAIKRGLAA